MTDVHAFRASSLPHEHVGSTYLPPNAMLAEKAPTVLGDPTSILSPAIALHLRQVSSGQEPTWDGQVWF